MICGNRREYASAADWLAALRQDAIWQSQLQQLQDSPAKDVSHHYESAMRRIGNGTTYEFWEIYQHRVEPVVDEIWEIGELSLVNLKIQTIGMLSIAWLEQHAKLDSMPPDTATYNNKVKRQATKKSEKPKKSRETMTFGRRSGVLDAHLSLLYERLVQEKWIDGNEADFKALFSGKKDEDCQLTWQGLYGKGTLMELFKQLVTEGLVTVADGFTLSAILEGHFKDKTGAWLTGLDKGNGANDKALPTIRECVKLLRITLDRSCQDDEDFQSKYDPYDHQDMHLHKR